MKCRNGAITRAWATGDDVGQGGCEDEDEDEGEGVLMQYKDEQANWFASKRDNR